MTAAIRAAVASFSSADLRYARRVIEAELIAVAKSGRTATQAHAGQLEMLAAIGEELDHRGALIPPPPWVEACSVTEYGATVRLPCSVRVF